MLPTLTEKELDVIMSIFYSRSRYSLIRSLHHDLKKGGWNRSKLCLRGKRTFRLLKSGYLRSVAMRIMGRERHRKCKAPGRKFKQFGNSTRVGEPRVGNKMLTGASNKFTKRWGHSSDFELNLQNGQVFKVSSDELMFLEITELK